MVSAANRTFERLVRRLTYKRYGGPIDIELAFYCFLLFLYPLGAYWVWDTKLFRRVLAAIFYPGSALLLSTAVGFLTALTRQAIVNQHRPGKVYDDSLGNPVAMPGAITGAAIGLGYLCLTVLISVLLQMPSNAWFIVVVISVVSAALLAISHAVYNFILVADLDANSQNPDVLKQLISSCRTVFHVMGFVFVALILVPIFAFKDVVATFLLREEDRIWGTTWFFLGLAVLGVSLIVLILVRIADLHGLWIKELNQRTGQVTKPLPQDNPTG